MTDSPAMKSPPPGKGRYNPWSSGRHQATRRSRPFQETPMAARWWFLALPLLVVPSRGLARGNGLEGNDRDTWYHLSQGTEFFPLSFLRALNDAKTGAPFMTDLERF